VAEFAILADGFVDLTADGVNVHRGECLLIENGRIAGFAPLDRLSDRATVIDRSGEFCLPGLVDTAFLPGLIVYENGARPETYGQSVWRARRACERWVTGGVTSAGSMGASDRMDFDLGRAIDAGRAAGPRIYPALSPLVPAGAAKFHKLYGVREVSGRDEARRAVRELIKHGAERIVVYADIPLEFHADPHQTSRHRLTFSVDELAEMVAQARQAGCFVHAQAISSAAIENCLAVGVRSIGCAFGLKPEHLPVMVQKQIALAPNLALGSTVQEFGPTAGFPAGTIAMVASQRIGRDLLLQAHSSGIEILCGTNAAFLAGDVSRECLELHRIGLSTTDVLRAATQNGARTLKPYCQSGDFESNHFADFLFVRRDPMQDMRALGEVSAVMVRGSLQ
jgi:imidazolonepropionase-like amidohydrolase